MPGTSFTLTDLMSLLMEKTGLPASAHTTDPDARFADIGLDSLAFLSMQTELHDRFGTEMPDDSPDRYTFGEIVTTVDTAVRRPAEIA